MQPRVQWYSELHGRSSRHKRRIIESDLSVFSSHKKEDAILRRWSPSVAALPLGLGALRFLKRAQRHVGPFLLNPASVVAICLFLVILSEPVEAQSVTVYNITSANGPSLQSVDAFYRLLAAMGMAAVIGLEREYVASKFHVKGLAGIRTHLTVAVAACLIQMISVYGYSLKGASPTRDPARLAAQAVSGIGFLGAGAIFNTSGSIRRGLTTAGTIWLCMAIGLGCGVGFYQVTAIATGIGIFVLIFMRHFKNLVFPNEELTFVDALLQCEVIDVAGSATDNGKSSAVGNEILREVIATVKKTGGVILTVNYQRAPLRDDGTVIVNVRDNADDDEDQKTGDGMANSTSSAELIPAKPNKSTASANKRMFVSRVEMAVLCDTTQLSMKIVAISRQRPEVRELSLLSGAELAHEIKARHGQSTHVEKLAPSKPRSSPSASEFVGQKNFHFGRADSWAKAQKAKSQPSSDDVAEDDAASPTHARAQAGDSIELVNQRHSVVPMSGGGMLGPEHAAPSVVRRQKSRIAEEAPSAE